MPGAVIGTRGSALALAQAHIARRRLLAVQPDAEVQLKVVATTGDRDQQSSLRDIGGKGVFIKEIEQALLEGTVDIAVHSFKDITAQIAPGLVLCGFLSPESVCDVLISRDNVTLECLPDGAVVATGSARRRALLTRLRPGLRLCDVRGNVDTRIRKLDNGEYDALVLSQAGLMRLGLEGRIAQRFDPKRFYPAPGQGVIAFETRANDSSLRNWCERASDQAQVLVSRAERSALERLGFDCRTAFGVYTRREGAALEMSGFWVDPHSGAFVEHSCSAQVDSPEELGSAFAAAFKGGGAA